MGQAPDRNMDDPSWWVGMAIFLTGWVTIFSQLYLFLRDGVWVSFSIVKAFSKLPFGIAERLQIWAATPESWFGLHSVLDFLPFSVSTIVLGFLIMLSAHVS